MFRIIDNLFSICISLSSRKWFFSLYFARLTIFYWIFSGSECWSLTFWSNEWFYVDVMWEESIENIFPVWWNQQLHNETVLSLFPFIYLMCSIYWPIWNLMKRFKCSVAKSNWPEQNDECIWTNHSYLAQPILTDQHFNLSLALLLAMFHDCVLYDYCALLFILHSLNSLMMIVSFIQTEALQRIIFVFLTHFKVHLKHSMQWMNLFIVKWQTIDLQTLIVPAFFTEILMRIHRDAYTFFYAHLNIYINSIMHIWRSI